MKNFIYLFLLVSIFSCSKRQIVLKDKVLFWEENFDQLDETRWSKIPRGTAPWQVYMSDYDSLYAIRNGNLILRGIVNNTQKHDTASYLTGGVYTKDKVGFGLGRIEIRAKIGEASGSWPAFWLLGQGRKYPEGGEIDIMEHLNFDNFAYQTVHSYYTITLNEKKNPPQGGTGRIFPNEYNVYAVEKYKDSVVLFINDVKTLTYPRIKTEKKDQFPYAEGDHYLLLDMQLGGNWAGKVNLAHLPVEMEIDWVRFYKFKED